MKHKKFSKEDIDGIKKMFEKEELKELVEKASNNELDEKELGTFHVVFTNQTEDRDGEIILAKGGDVKNFKKNPIVLLNHQYMHFPIGIAPNIKRIENRWEGKGFFAPTNSGQTARKLHDAGFLRAVSMGFIPLERDVEKEHIIKRWELLEFSFVTIPSNPTALSVEQKEFLKKEGEELNIFESDFEEEQKFAEAVCCKMFGIEVKTSEPNDQHPPDEKSMEGKTVVRHSIGFGKAEISWDGSKARKRLASWASSDGSGEKDKMNWKKYANGFTWFDGEIKESFGSYKFPHHDIIGDDFILVKRGVETAMGALLGARGGVDIPDSEFNGIYNHLAKHYREYDLDPPENPRKSKEGNEEKTLEQRVEKIEENVSNISISLVKLLNQSEQRANSDMENSEIRGGFDIQRELDHIRVMKSITTLTNEYLRKAREKNLKLNNQ